MPKPTYYEILEIDSQAPTTEVKSQYRRLAKRYHPDLNPNSKQAVQHFHEVQQAYEVLSDPEKRRNYDATIFPDARPGRNPTNRARTYRRYDGRYRQQPRSNRPVSRPHQPRENYLHYKVEVSLEDLFKGTRHPLIVGLTFTCGRCNGTGRLEENAVCGRCGGYGFVVSYTRTEITIPPGMQPDMSIRVAVNNDEPEHSILESPVGTSVEVSIQLKSSYPFEYRDQKLYITTEVPAHVLADGGEWTIPAPEGGATSFTIPPNTNSGTTLTLRKLGLRNGSTQRRGNLFCTVVAE